MRFQHFVLFRFCTTLVTALILVSLPSETAEMCNAGVVKSVSKESAISLAVFR